jgi:hypothetical protein
MWGHRGPQTADKLRLGVISDQGLRCLLLSLDQPHEMAGKRIETLGDELMCWDLPKVALWVLVNSLLRAT